MRLMHAWAWAGLVRHRNSLDSSRLLTEEGGGSGRAGKISIPTSLTLPSNLESMSVPKLKAVAAAHSISGLVAVRVCLHPSLSKTLWFLCLCVCACVFVSMPSLSVCVEAFCVLSLLCPPRPVPVSLSLKRSPARSLSRSRALPSLPPSRQHEVHGPVFLFCHAHTHDLVQVVQVVHTQELVGKEDADACAIFRLLPIATSDVHTQGGDNRGDREGALPERAAASSDAHR